MKPTRRARIHDRDDPRHHLAAWDRDGFAQLLRAEFTKFRTVRAWMITLCAAAVVFVLLSFLSALASRAAIPPYQPVRAAKPSPTPTCSCTKHSPATAPSRPGSPRFRERTPRLRPPRATASSQSSKSQLGSQLQPGLAPWAKAGIILEPDTNQGTDYAAVMVTGSHGVQMQYNYTHDSPGLTGAVGPSSPRWLRLTRVGDVITGYDSIDGVHWTEIGTARLTGLPHTVQIGLFVTSPLYFAAGANNGTPSVATANFDHVSTQGDLPRRSWTGDTIAGFYPSLPSDSTWQQQSADTFTISGSGDIAPLVGDIVSTNWSGASIVNGTIVALLIVIVLAALFATSEYRRGLIRTTSTASPRRGASWPPKPSSPDRWRLPPEPSLPRSPK